MTTGALIFAFNNEEVDYIAMASWSAENIRRLLNIPVAVVTDCTDFRKTKRFDVVINAQPQSGGTRYFEDYCSNVTWYNAGRCDAYRLSPWERTLVLDADYVVASNQLSTILETPQNFLCHRLAYDITGSNSFESLNYFGSNRMPMSWATVMMFTRSKEAEAIFDIMSMVRDHKDHYWNLYGINRGTFRNDYALSIALNTVYGYQARHPEIPWRLASLTPENQLYQTSEDHYRVEFVNSVGRLKYITISKQDFHAMGKLTLGAIVDDNR